MREYLKVKASGRFSKTTFFIPVKIVRKTIVWTTVKIDGRTINVPTEAIEYFDDDSAIVKESQAA